VETVREVSSEIPRLRNLGKVSAGWLYLRLKSLGYNVSLNLLWALQGAVLDVPWNEIPQEMKNKLRAEVEAAERERPRYRAHLEEL
jgi:DNA transformation protein